LLHPNLEDIVTSELRGYCCSWTQRKLSHWKFSLT